jgi:Rrf2 family protein
MLNQSAEYAVRVAVRLAKLAPDAWAQANDLAADVDVPANYLSKLLHQLAATGVLESRRGRGGGFRLGRPAEAITMAEVVAPFDPPGRYRECLLGGSRCSAASACVAHEHWKPIADRMLAFLDETTVAQLAGRDVPRPRTGTRDQRVPRAKARNTRRKPSARRA